MTNNILIDALKPAIKPGFRKAEKEILELIKKIQEKHFPDKQKELHVLLSEHKQKIILSPVLLDSDTQKIKIAPKEIQDEFVSVQPLVPFLLKSFNKVAKKEKK